MSEFNQKLFLALIGALAGGIIGFGSQYYFSIKRRKKTKLFLKESLKQKEINTIENYKIKRVPCLMKGTLSF